jgi:hypothetical protein
MPVSGVWEFCHGPGGHIAGHSGGGDGIRPARGEAGPQPAGPVLGDQGGVSHIYSIGPARRAAVSRSSGCFA